MARPDPNAPREAIRLDGGATVLVADADEHLRDIYATLLGHHGYRPVEAADGLAAVTLARELRPDALVLDLEIPGPGGVEVMRLLRDDPATAEIPTVLLSVRSEVGVRLQARRVGGLGFLEKPFAPGQLLAEVRRALATAPAPLALHASGA
ncbi:MAG TPA: response regulator [Longimicrobiaceae bacterium]|nr:response regulator [Longimicrobiaceae bacterium]